MTDPDARALATIIGTAGNNQLPAQRALHGSEILVHDNKDGTATTEWISVSVFGKGVDPTKPFDKDSSSYGAVRFKGKRDGVYFDLSHIIFQGIDGNDAAVPIRGAINSEALFNSHPGISLSPANIRTLEEHINKQFDPRQHRLAQAASATGFGDPDSQQKVIAVLGSAGNGRAPYRDASVVSSRLAVNADGSTSWIRMVSVNNATNYRQVGHVYLMGKQVDAQGHASATGGQYRVQSIVFHNQEGAPVSIRAQGSILTLNARREIDTLDPGNATLLKKEIDAGQHEALKQGAGLALWETANPASTDVNKHGLPPTAAMLTALTSKKPPRLG